MSDKQNEISLIGFICSPYLTKVTNTPLLGRPYLRLIDYHRLIAHIYMIGAILGRSRPDKLHKLARLFVVHGTPASGLYELISFSRNCACENLEKFKKESGKEPDTFDEYVFFANIRRLLEFVSISMSPEDALEAYAKLICVHT